MGEELDKEKKITKCEILWSRKCSLKCSYCSMVSEKENILTFKEWNQTFSELKKLNCEFIAFYGAEPLLENVNKLAKCIFELKEKWKIDNTIITSGIVPNFDEKIDFLYKNGLRSLTMSNDIVPLGKGSKIKSKISLEKLLSFSRRKNIRDVAMVTTLNKQNFMELPNFIEKMTKKGIWVLFDIIHPDRNQEGSKVKGKNKSFLFTDNDFRNLEKILEQVKTMKKKGYLCHTSNLFLERIKKNNFEVMKKYNWKCFEHKSFPAWLTIDNDGSVYPCDDYHTETDFKSFDISKRFNEFKKFYLKKEDCPGCIWNTHFDAHMIKENRLKIDNYTHTKKRIKNDIII